MGSHNSRFKLSVIVKTENEQENKDSFAFRELDQFACYVFTYGLNDQQDALSAGSVIETVIRAFQEHPSINKKIIPSYLESAKHTLEEVEGALAKVESTLAEAKERHNLEASVTVVVSDYKKIRYAYVGNTGLKIYRNGTMTEQTEADPLHFVNKFTSFVSKEIKLVNGDILTLCTLGSRKNLDNRGQDAVCMEGKRSAPDGERAPLEKLLFSQRLKDLENDTFAVIIADRLDLASGKRQWTGRQLIISAMMAVFLTVLCLSLGFMYCGRVNNTKALEKNYKDMIEYIKDDNYRRAEQKCLEALNLAEKLKDKKRIEEIKDSLMLIEAVNKADEYYKIEKYREARSGYLTAKKRWRRTDSVANEYINEQLSKITNYFLVLDYIEQGDELKIAGDYAEAEEIYLQAKDLATDLYFQSARWEAINALEEMYLELIYMELLYMEPSYMEQSQFENDILNGYVVVNDEVLVLEERIIMDGRLSMVLPENFETMEYLEQSDEMEESVFQEWMYGMEEDGVTLTFLLDKGGPYMEEDIRLVPDMMLELMGEDFSGFELGDRGIIGEGTETISWISLTAPPEEDGYLYFVFARALPEGVVFGLFECDEYEKEEWEFILCQLLGTIKEPEADAYEAEADLYL